MESIAQAMLLSMMRNVETHQKERVFPQISKEPLSDCVVIATYFPAGEHGFWVKHRCKVIDKHNKPLRYLCEDCGKELTLRNSRFLDEYWSIRVLEPGHEFDQPSYFCTEDIQIIIHCVERYPGDLPDVLHERCAIDTSSYSGYTRVNCLNCGRESVLAINSFSMKEKYGHYEQAVPCCHESRKQNDSLDKTQVERKGANE